MNIDLTIVICVYNSEKFIVETLDSLNKQTFKNFKLLIIDDCSTDDTIEKINEYLHKYNFFSVEIIKLKKNKGTAYVRNFALGYVNTPLMMFFDSDDIAKPVLVEKLYKKIKENDNYIAVSCYSEYIDSSSNLIGGGQYIGPINEQEFFQIAKNGKLIFMLPPTLFKREYALKAGGYRLKGFPINNNNIRYQDLSEDLDLWSRMSDFYKEGKIMITIPEVLFYYRKNTSSLSSSRNNLIAMQNKIRYIKYNLKRRRQNKKDIDFIKYIENLSLTEKVKNFFKDNSAYFYRQAGFAYIRKKYILFLLNILLSLCLNPCYLLEKIKNNFIKGK